MNAASRRPRTASLGTPVADHAWRRGARLGRGSTLVETALVLLAFLTLLFGIIELGRAWFTYNLVTHAVREGTRLASVKPLLSIDDGEVIGLVEGILGDAGVTPLATDVSFIQPLQTGRMVRVTSQVNFTPVVAPWADGGPFMFPMIVSMVTRYEI